jgi:uncharacterized protein (DUF1697 family)
MRWAALLKGFNLGRNRMPMPELKRLLEDAGYDDVRTLLASGNLVFEAADTDEAMVEAALEALLAAHGLKLPVLARNAAQMRAALAANPFADVAEARPAHLVAMFHREAVPVALLEQLSAVHAGPERLVAIDRELYIDFPLGQGQSVLPQAMAQLKFPKVATARNWNTVVKLAALLGA